MNEATLRALSQAMETRDAAIIKAHVECFNSVRQLIEKGMVIYKAGEVSGDAIEVKP